MTQDASVAPLRLPLPVLAGWARAILAAAGVDPEQTGTVAENLLWNDAAGRRNHGLERLPVLLDRVAEGLIRCPADTRLERLGPSQARLCGGDGFGQHAGRLAIDAAMDLARETGLGVVGVNASNFYGTGAYFVARAAEAGFVSLALSNSFPKVAAAGGVRPVLGTNPFAFGAPRAGGHALIVDMSTAGLAGSTVRAAERAGTPLPEGLAIDAQGRPLTDPVAARKGTLLPAAGAKGFGLALMVEVLAGVLTGAGIASGVGSLYAGGDRPANSGHFFLVIDPARWMSPDEWTARMEGLADTVRASAPEGIVRLPGEARWEALAQSREHGVVLETGLAARLRDLSRAHGVSFPQGA